MSVIHRQSMKGGTLCGARKDAFGHLKLSYYGFGVTYADCKLELAERRGDMERCPHCGAITNAHRSRCGACLRIRYLEVINA